MCSLKAGSCAAELTPVATGEPTERVLIVADEIPAMQVLAGRLKAEEGIESRIVNQGEMPAELSLFPTVIVYIHKNLAEATELALINYVTGGGKLIALHHSISSAKRKNREWFKFLGVRLPSGDVKEGGYQWAEDVTMTIVALKPEHFITTNKVTWPERVDWNPTGATAREQRPAVTLNETEVYLNHVLDSGHTLLVGLKYTDPKTNGTYQQAHAGWVRTVSRGTVVYLLPGHSEREFKDPVYGRMVLNAVVWRP